MNGAGRYAGILAGLILWASLARAEPAASSVYDFDIPPQPLMSAVEAFAAASGIQVLYDRPVGGRPLSPGVHGHLSPEEALQRLLKGTGLTARFTDPGNVVLTPPDGAPAPPPPNLPTLALSPLKVQGSLVIEAAGDDGVALRLYAALVRDGVQQALAAAPKTSMGDYDAALDLWIGPKGDIARADLATSSGKAERDREILAVVRGLELGEAPPPNLPQPIRIGVRSRHP